MNAFGIKVELDGMLGAGPEEVIINLEGIVVEIEFANAMRTSGKISDSGNVDQADGTPRDESQGGVPCRRVDETQRCRRQRHGAVEAEAGRVDQCRCEDVRLLDRSGMPARKGSDIVKVKGVGVGIVALIEHVGSKQAIGRGNLGIDTAREKVLVRNCLRDKGKRYSA